MSGENRRKKSSRRSNPNGIGCKILCVLCATISFCARSPDAFFLHRKYPVRSIKPQSRSFVELYEEEKEPLPQGTNNLKLATPPQGSSSDIRFCSPLLDFGYPPAVEEYEKGTNFQKPLLLYLPGFDGTYLSAFFQYPELHTLFEVRCLVSTMDDRSTFDDLKASVIDFILEQIQENQRNTTISATTTAKNSTTYTEVLSALPSFVSNMFKWTATSRRNATQSATINSNRPIYLAGESFGGILASDVALTLLEEYKLDNLKGLVLINAATCYERSKLAAKGPSIYRLPKLLYPFGILRLLPMFLDDVSFPQFLAIIQGKALPSVIDDPLREAYMGRFAFSLPALLEFMPQDTFHWRLEEWLEVGSNRMTTKLNDLAKYESLRTLIIAGEKDLALPSIAEAERLAQKLPNSQVHVVDGAGHANTCGSRLDMAAVMRNRFEELRTTKLPRRRRDRKEGQGSLNTDIDGEQEGRIEMKKVAAEGKGIYFGLEPRYDGKRFGLSPLKYWSREYYWKPVFLE